MSGTNPIRYGTKEVEITRVELLDGFDNPKQSFHRGERLRVRLSFYAKSIVEEPDFSVAFFEENGQAVYKNTTREKGFKTGEVCGEGEVVFTIESLPLHSGQYSLSVGCWDANGYLAYDHHTKMYSLQVEKGIEMPDEWEIRIHNDIEISN